MCAIGENLAKGNKMKEESDILDFGDEETEHSPSLIKGLKRQAVKDFVQYLKNNHAGEIKTDLTMDIKLNSTELDRALEKFLEV